MEVLNYWGDVVDGALLLKAQYAGYMRRIYKNVMQIYLAPSSTIVGV